MDTPENECTGENESITTEEAKHHQQPHEDSHDLGGSTIQSDEHEESPLIENSSNPELKQESPAKIGVRIAEPLSSPKTTRRLEECHNVGDGESNEDDSEDDSVDIDDALDEGYMGMECTLERGFSLNEAAIAHDLRMERYDEVAIDYQPGTNASRYRQSLKHFIPVRKPPKEKDEMPLDHTGLYSYVMYSWITGLMWKAYKTGLKEDDIPICSKYDMCDYNTNRLEKMWLEELKAKGRQEASFHKVVLRFIRTRLIVGLLLFVITLVMGFIGPTIFMRYLITWMSSDEPVSTGLIWTFGLVLSELTRVLMFGLVFTVNYRTGIRLRAACMGLVYKKLMRMTTLGSKSIGEVINLFANDAQRIYDYVMLGPLIVGGPFVAVGGVIYILWLLGPWALFGMLTFLLFYPFQYGISRLTSYLRRRTVRITDERVCKMNELLTCVKLIKMYAWEKSFADSIAEIRSRERQYLEKSAYVQSISLAMAPTVPVLAAIITFLAHVGAGYNLTAAQAYSLLMLFNNVIRNGFNYTPYIVCLVEACCSFSRLKAMSFLGLVGHLHFAMDCTYHCSVAIRGGQISLKRTKAFSVVSLFVKNVRQSLNKVRVSSYVISEFLVVHGRVKAMSVITVLLGIVRASFNMITVSMKSFIEGVDSIGRMEAFSLMSYMVRVRGMLHYVPYSSLAIMEGDNTELRLKSILLMEEISPYLGKPGDQDVTISMESATLAWDAVTLEKGKKKKKRNIKQEESPAHKLLPKAVIQEHIDVLFGINLTIKKGELIAVCGSVGAGKSSLLSALLGHMRLRSGKVNVQGTFAYVGQQAWILNATFRDNILLDEAFDAKRYYRAIHACSLSEDIGIMPAGDFTEIGERGINLSGGQKQRLSLARALYANKDIYLLDDPLSAVDSYVGSHIFQWVIKGALRNKTTVFVTHQLQYLPMCDRIVYLKDGYTAEIGTHAELMEKSEEFATLYKQHIDTVEKDDKKRERSSESSVRTRQDSTMSNDSQRNGVCHNSPEKNPAKEVKKDLQQKSGQLVTEEKIDRGNIPMNTYHMYIKAAGGYIISTLVIFTFILNVGSTAFSSWWLSLWLSAGSGNTTITIGNDTVISENIADNPDQSFYQTVYACLIVVILGTSLLRGFAFMKTTLRASSRLHNQVFIKVFRSPMSFFDTTPIGRIINVFSRDMDEIDVRLPNSLEAFVQNIWLITSALVFVCMVFPHFIPILVVLAVLFGFIRKVFRIGIRDFKRIENVSRSPLYSHVSTTVNGLVAINAYGKQKMFTKKFMVLFDENSCVFFLFNCAMRWLAIRLDVLALTVTAGTAGFCLILRGYVDATFAGLALAYAAQLSGIFQYTVRLSTETEARFTSVQRITNYAKGLISEAPAIIESSRPEEGWPKYGRVTFRKVQMRYRPEMPLVLREVSFDIDSMENIGIVGRTGSGKSSLGVVLFRLVELDGGSIRIDGVNTANIGLEDLRSRLSIIPQDPILFIGTVRYNLDPFERHSDEEIWFALEQTYMKERIAILELKLNAPVVENGENFSVGERQLICMARALLRNSKILFLDEATAAIDTETDVKIQRTLKDAFKLCTMITVAHRLNTVMSCSRVLVMDNGTVAEFDTPKKLLKNPSSLFSKMVVAADFDIQRQ